MNNYDVIIIGGGPGGYVSAIKAAQLGSKVAVVEDGNLGGVCLNWGCIPTKTMLTTAKLYKDILGAKEFGIEGIDGDKVDVDWNKLLDRKEKIVDKLINGIRMLFKKNKVELIEGFGTVKDKETIEVNGKIYKTKNLIIATGAKEVYPEIEGLKQMEEKEKIIYSKLAFDLKEIPESIVIIAGNQYSVEFANLFNLLGSNVVLIHQEDRILPYVEKEMAKTLERQLKKEGVKFVSDATFKSINEDGIVIEQKGKEKTFKADKYLISWDIKPNIKGLEALNLKKGKNGFIETDETMKTNIDGVYAIGDVNGKYPLAHVASAEGIVAAENINGKKSKMDYTKVPLLIYTSPELASVGLTEEAAKEKGLDITVSKFPLAANGKAMSEGDTVGFIKVISENKYGEIVGTHIMSNNADNMISSAVSIMQLEGTVYDMAKTILPHPTTSEVFMEAAFGAIDKPIHM
ncbi:dihydrolipoyl dehydrogenase [Tissierella creatinophila]|uniref:Dihydrolipoyl dehydrogenase n=1 Tax=Tissierella creatinophila DSM 6911 TaxID=1123403 RepID=A0A1U7M2H1_TISCR|nr:dihydrolipoyl dehydrogenase [Tissierella creatinophila]OLS01507.1 dihydrolipoyl dehydrogenase [Tissierella creatinophila DSM 6911]